MARKKLSPEATVMPLANQGTLVGELVKVETKKSKAGKDYVIGNLRIAGQYFNYKTGTIEENDHPATVDIIAFNGAGKALDDAGIESVVLVTFSVGSSTWTSPKGHEEHSTQLNIQTCQVLS